MSISSLANEYLTMNGKIWKLTFRALSQEMSIFPELRESFEGNSLNGEVSKNPNLFSMSLCPELWDSYEWRGWGKKSTTITIPEPLPWTGRFLRVKGVG